MADQKAKLSADALMSRGFSIICNWQVTDGRLECPTQLPDEPGVYAFCIEGTACYIGLASKSLAKRIKFYARPGPTQTTNIRLNALLASEIGAGRTIDILVASPPDLEWNGWRISGAEGLEAALINDYELAWNVRGVSRVRQAGSPKAAQKSKDRDGSPPVQGVSSKYGPLRAFLEDCGKDRISLTFKQIEEMVGPLPKSASLHQAWWANHEGNSQAKAWLNASYMVEVNPAGRSAIFRKYTR